MEPLNVGKALVELNRIGTVLDADLIVGSDADEPGRLSNSLYFVSGGRFDFTRYDKRNLVPFGEFVPAEFRWAFGGKVTTGDRDYTPGRLPPALIWPRAQTSIGLSICFESILARHARQAVNDGAQVLIVAANDAWLPAYATAQHKELTALRGLEVGRDTLFVSNGGGAALISEGRIVARSDAPLWVQVAARPEQTLWSRWGGWNLIGLMLSLLTAGALWKRCAARRVG